MAQRLRRRQDDDRTAGQAHASLRNRRDRKRILTLQKPLSKLKPKSQSAAPDQAVQPRPASPDRALTGVPFTSSNRGPFYTKRRGPVSTVIDRACLARRRRIRPTTGRSPRPAVPAARLRATPRPSFRAPSAYCPRCGRPGAAPRSDARARSPAPRSARAAWQPERAHGLRSAPRPRPRGRARSGRARPCWRRPGRPGPRRAPLRSLREAGGAKAARSRSAQGRGSASWVGWVRGSKWTPGVVDAGGRAGLRTESSGRDGRPAIRRVFVGDFSGLAWIRSPGGFPKIRPCRWRSIALRPPAYDFRQEGPANSYAQAMLT